VLYAADGNSQAGAAGGGSAGDGSTTQTAAITTSPFVINITWDSSVSAAPAAFKTAVLSAVQYLESQFTDAVTVNISVGYGEADGTPMDRDSLGASQSLLSTYSYNSYLSALSTDRTSPLDTTAAASLPSTPPAGSTIWTTTADAKALGLSTSTTRTDGYVGFSNVLPWTYSDTAGVAAGTYDFTGVALHELTEVMGRILLTGSTVAGFADSQNLMDLFHYSAPGVRDFSSSTAGYFSADGGATSLGAFNTVAGGDAGDWASSVTSDSFDAFSSSGVVNGINANDLSVMNVLGWNQAPAPVSSSDVTSVPTGIPSASSSVSTSVPTGISVAATTSGLNSAQTPTGLAANAALARVGQEGGVPSDSYSYALGGTSGALFALTPAGNTAVLAVGNLPLSGASGGRLYSLTVTPTDTTSGRTGPASPIGVVVGTSADDTVSVATLTQALGVSTPTFVYGLGGNDTLNGTGMTGQLFITGGAGADTMTGGIGLNDYLFGSTADSTPKTLDTITNFHVPGDVIDLTGLGTNLTYAGQIVAAAKLGPDSIGWLQSNGNTLVYVNTTPAAQPLAAASMEIKLTGLLVLTTGNFAHA
jgi:hypothetical protein